jgi:hypothetical protein
MVLDQLFVFSAAAIILGMDLSVELDTILLKEHLQIALEMLEVGICSSL